MCASLLAQVTHVVSQSDVVKLLWANKSVLGAALTQTVEQLELDDVGHSLATGFAEQSHHDSLELVCSSIIQYAFAMFACLDFVASAYGDISQKR